MACLFRIAILLGIASCKVDAKSNLVARFEWKQIDFDYPNENARAEAIKSGEFIPQNNLPLGVERWNNKLFVTCPRWKDGTAATLTYIDLDTREKSPKLKPYPNWEAHKLRENNGVAKIANVFRLNVDACERLWLLDTGLVGLLAEKRERVHAAKIQVYDLRTDQLLKEYPLPESVVRENSFLANIVADVDSRSCDAAFAYVADLGSNALVVYDMRNDHSYRVTHHFFHFDPLSGDYNIGGVNFQWTDGLFGLALSAIQPDGFRTLYFHPMSSTSEFAVSTRVVRNETTASSSYHEYRVLGSRGPSGQSTASSVDEASGVLVYAMHNKNAVGCWNTGQAAYSAETNAVLASDDRTMVFPNDLKVDKSGTLWLLTDRLQDLIYKQLDFDQVNFRIFSAPVKHLVEGTVCDKASSSSRATATNVIIYTTLAVIVVYLRN